MPEPQPIALCYAPQVDLVSGVLVGVDAAACKGGEASEGPGAVVSDRGERTLRQACLEAGRWQREGAGRFRVSVKVCARDLRSAAYVDRVRAILRESGLEGGHLELELQETAAVAYADVITDTLRRLERVGVKLALGAFGMTRCSLTTLQRLGCHRLKIHPAFLRVTGAHNRLPVARAIVELGRTMRIGVIAEGIETRRVVDLLAEYGCREGQGPYYGSGLSSPVFAAGLWVAATKAGLWMVPAPWLTDAARVPLTA